MSFETAPVTRADSRAAAGGERPTPCRTKPSRYTPSVRCGARGPTVTRLPPRTITSVSGSPFEPVIVREMVPPVIGFPLIETIRSPLASPMAAAADPARTLSIVVVGFPPEVM